MSDNLGFYGTRLYGSISATQGVKRKSQSFVSFGSHEKDTSGSNAPGCLFGAFSGLKQKIVKFKDVFFRIQHIKRIKENRENFLENILCPLEVEEPSDMKKKFSQYSSMFYSDKRRDFLQNYMSNVVKKYGGVEYNLKCHSRVNDGINDSYNLLICKDGTVLKTPLYAAELKDFKSKDPEFKFGYLEFPEEKKTLTEEEFDKITAALCEYGIYFNRTPNTKNTYQCLGHEYYFILPPVEEDKV